MTKEQFNAIMKELRAIHKLLENDSARSDKSQKKREKESENTSGPWVNVQLSKEQMDGYKAIDRVNKTLRGE